LFQIDTDPRLENVKSLADVNSLSFIPDEEEMLMMLRSVFRIINMCLVDGIWITQMTLCSDNDHDLKSLLDHIKDEYHNDGKKNVGLLGTVLTKMRKFDDAERYFLRSIKKWLSNHQNTNSTYQNLGLMTYDKGNYD
jgi:hypothetical protein